MTIHDNGETFNDKDGVTLKEFFLAKLKDQERALDLARTQMEKRLEGMNEFRETLRDQAAKFVTREELRGAVDKMDIQLDQLKRAKDIAEGKASTTSVYVGYILSAIAIIISLVKLAQ